MTSPIDDNTIEALAEQIGINTRLDNLGLNLGYDYAAIDIYKAINYSGGLVTYQGTKQMLMDWKCKTPQEQQRPKLRKALEDAGLFMLADKYLEGGKRYPGGSSRAFHSTDIETLQFLAERFPHDYYNRLASKLGIHYNKARSILMKYNHDYRAAILECLHKWKDRTGGSLTELKRILLSIELGGLVKYIEQDEDEVDVSEAVERGMVTCNRSRIMVVGPAGVGKTCFICRLTSQGFRPDEPSTIGTIQTSVTSGWKIEEKIRDATAESLFRYQEGAQNNKNTDAQSASSATSGTTGASAAQRETTGAQSESAGAYRGSEPNVRVHRMPSERIYNVKSTANDVTYSIWDFGGQEIYYITHPLFLSWRALYIVVFPLHKQLTEEALRVEMPCDDPLPGCVPRTHRTMRDLIKFWLMSIYIHAVPRPDIADASKYEPQILLVGTFQKNSTPDKIDQQKESLYEIVKGEPYASQVISDIVEVDNKFSKEEEISKIQKLIDKHITEAEYMKEKLPIKWRLFLDEMNKLDQDTLKMEEAKEIMRGIGIDNEGVLGALQFCHEAGYLIFHPGCDLIVVRPKFLNDIVNNIITVNTNMKKGELSEDWKKLKDYGVLSLSLVKAVWEQHEGKEDELDMVITLMIKFDLMCEFKDSEERQFYVPCMSSPKLSARQNVSNYDTYEFAIDFSHFLPDGYLHRLYVRMTKWAIDQGGTKKPAFHCREMIFHVDDRHRVTLENNINGAETHLIRVIIGAVKIQGKPEGDYKVDIDSVRKVIIRLKSELEYLKKTWARRISFSFSKRCEKCSRPGEPTLISVDKIMAYEGEAFPCPECPSGIYVRTVQEMFGNAASGITQKKLRELSFKLGNEWKAVGTFLDFENQDIQILGQQHKDIRECIFQMLLKWRTEKGVQATKEKLKVAVSRAGRSDLKKFIDRPDDE